MGRAAPSPYYRYSREVRKAWLHNRKQHYERNWMNYVRISWTYKILDTRMAADSTLAGVI